MELRGYQKEALDAIFNHYVNPMAKGNHPLVVLPTGSGKSLVVAEFCKRTLASWPEQNILILTHQQELVEQNEQELLTIWKDAPAGVYSAGLKRKEIDKITFASIQSIHRSKELFEHFDVILIDEAHLVPNKEGSMYRKVLTHVNVPVIGLTATPFRLGSGTLLDGDNALFTDICYDISNGDKFNKLVEDGYLCKLVTKETDTTIQTDDLKIRAGEFIPAELREVTDQDAITDAALEEVVRVGKDRKHWLIFAIDIDHANHICDKLLELGVTSEVVHSRMNKDRSMVLDSYREGTIKAIINVNVLTTGFNLKGIDLIVLLRPTASAVLHAQMIGRGLRVLEGKENCLVMDFAGNTARLGPINDLHIYSKKKGKGTGKPITKTCPECKSILHPSVKICPDCAHVFKFRTKLEAAASNLDVIKRIHAKEPFWTPVKNISYSIHRKPGKPDSMKVTYTSGLRSFDEWVCVAHKGYARQKANYWWFLMTGEHVAPTDPQEAIDRINSFNKPSKILVDDNGRYSIVADYEFDKPNNEAEVVRATQRYTR